MPTKSFDCDPAFIDRRQKRPFTQNELAKRLARIIVQTKHGITGKFLEQTILNHDAGPAKVFLGRLKNQMNSAIKIPPLGNDLCRAQQHGCMAIVPTRMHDARMFAGILRARFLVDWQRINVSPDPD
ncbi:hypothetical protein D3C80_1605890 [compost metagenome]